MEPREPRYETSDWSFKMIVISGAVIFLLIGFGLVLAARFYSRNRPPTFSDRLPPQPRLQINPRIDLQQLIERDQHRLSTYGWINKRSGRIRIPIERAMTLILREKLPFASNAPPKTETLRSDESYAGLEKTSERAP